MESATRGFAQWKTVPAPARGDVLRAVGDIMMRRKDEIADLMTREMGKPLTETRGDVQEGIDTGYYAASEGRRPFGHTVPSELRNKWAMSYRRSIGVAGLITPFNFPMARAAARSTSSIPRRRSGTSTSRGNYTTRRSTTDRMDIRAT